MDEDLKVEFLRLLAKRIRLRTVERRGVPPPRTAGEDLECSDTLKI